MLTIDDHDGVLRHATTADLPKLTQALRVARVAAHVVTDVLRAAGLGPDHVTVTPTVTHDARPQVRVTLLSSPGQQVPHWHRAHDADLITVMLPSRADDLARWVDAGGGGPPARRNRDTGRAA